MPVGKFFSSKKVAVGFILLIVILCAASAWTAAAIAVNIDAKNMKLVSALIVAAAISYPAIRDKVLFYRKRREANRNV